MENIEIKANQDGPCVLILAGVHGDEYEPILASIQLVERIKKKLKRGKVQVVPTVNKSAYERGQRCGDDGLDLARSCPGDLNGSATLRYAASVSEKIKACDYLIDLHTGGQLFDLYPLVGYMLHPQEDVLNVQRTMAKAFNLPLIWGTESSPEGRTLSIARDYGKPAIYVEYGGPGPVRSEIVEAYAAGCLNILAALEMLDDYIPVIKEPVFLIEDNHPQGGHLQGKMLSAHDGIFMSNVNVGQRIQEGQLWGSIFNPSTLEKHDVFADASGLVLFVRSAPRVRFEDSLGGILPLNY